MKRAQLTLDELDQLRWVLGGLLTVLAAVTVAYMDVGAEWLMVLTVLASLASTFWPSLPARVPRLVHVMAFPAIAAFFAGDLWINTELLPAMVRLDLLLMMYRAVMFRQRRDDLQLLVLGLFLVVVAGVLTVSLLFAVQILAYTSCALVFLLVLTLVESARRPGAEPPASGSPPARPPVPAWAGELRVVPLLRRCVSVLDWRIAALGFGLFIGLIGASAVLFLAIPRFELNNGMFLERFITRKARSGFSDTIKFGDVTEIQQDTSVAMHVDVPDPSRFPVSPYWRMLVLDEYRNGTFRMSAELRQDTFPRGWWTSTTVWGRENRRGGAVYTVYLEPGVSRFLPLLSPITVLRFSEAQTFRFGGRRGIMELAKEPATLTAYQVEAASFSQAFADEPIWVFAANDVTAASTEPPAERAELRRIVTGAVGTETYRAREFADRLGAWLQREHTYSLSPRIPSGDGDPLVRWIRSRNPGHCELFAGAFVLLARAAGFPARVVTGFHGGAWNGYATNSFTVRNSEAHAWVEIYDAESRTWLRADPLDLTGSSAAADAATLAEAHRTDRSWTARIDSLRVFWYRRIVNFDQETQVQTVQAAKELAQSFIERLRSRVHLGVSGMKEWLRAPWDMNRAVWVGACVAGAALLTVAWRLLRFGLARLRWRSSAGREDPVRREAGRWLRRLPDAGPVVPELQRLRYGRRETWPAPAGVFRRAREAVRQRQIEE